MVWEKKTKTLFLVLCILQKVENTLDTSNISKGLSKPESGANFLKNVSELKPVPFPRAILSFCLPNSLNYCTYN